MPESIEQFSDRIRSKFPGAYDDVGDRELAERFVAKFPVYRDAVDLKEKPEIGVIETFKRGILPLAQAARQAKEEVTRVAETPIPQLEAFKERVRQVQRRLETFAPGSRLIKAAKVIPELLPTTVLEIGAIAPGLIPLKGPARAAGRVLKPLAPSEELLGRASLEAQRARRARELVSSIEANRQAIEEAGKKAQGFTMGQILEREPVVQKLIEQEKAAQRFEQARIGMKKRIPTEVSQTLIEEPRPITPTKKLTEQMGRVQETDKKALVEISKTPEKKALPSDLEKFQDASNKDISAFGFAVRKFRPAQQIAKGNPVAERLVQHVFDSEDLGFRLAGKFERRMARFTKDLTPLEDKQTGLLLDLYKDTSEIPRQDIAESLIKKFAERNKTGEGIASQVIASISPDSTLSPRAIRAFSNIRKFITQPLARLAELGNRTIPEYFTRIFSHIKDPAQRAQIIRTFSQENGISETLAQFILQRSVPKRVFFGPLVKARSLNLPEELFLFRNYSAKEVLSAYVRGASRKIAGDRANLADNLLAQLPEGSRIHQAMLEFLGNFRSRPPSYGLGAKIARAEGIRQFASKLGANVFSAVQNLTQLYINTFPKLAGEEGLAKGFLALLKGQLQFFTRRGQRILQAQGITRQTGKAEALLGESGIKSIQRTTERVLDSLGALFEAVERFNRGVTFLAKQSAQLKRKIPIKEARTQARRLVTETQFRFTEAGRLPAARGSIGRTILRFQQFSIQELGFFASLSVKEKAVFLGMVGAIGGPQAIPGLRQLYQYVLENKPDSQLGLALQAMDNLSVSKLTGIPLLQRGDVGFIPSTRALTQQGDLFRFLAQFLGPTGSDAAKIVRELQKSLAQGEITKDEAKEILFRVVPAGSAAKRFLENETFLEKLFGTFPEEQ